MVKQKPAFIDLAEEEEDCDEKETSILRSDHAHSASSSLNQPNYDQSSPNVDFSDRPSRPRIASAFSTSDLDPYRPSPINASTSGLDPYRPGLINAWRQISLTNRRMKEQEDRQMAYGNQRGRNFPSKSVHNSYQASSFGPVDRRHHNEINPNYIPVPPERLNNRPALLANPTTTNRYSDQIGPQYSSNPHFPPKQMDFPTVINQLSDPISSQCPANQERPVSNTNPFNSHTQQPKISLAVLNCGPIPVVTIDDGDPEPEPVSAASNPVHPVATPRVSNRDPRTVRPDPVKEVCAQQQPVLLQQTAQTVNTHPEPQRRAQTTKSVQISDDDDCLIIEEVKAEHSESLCEVSAEHLPSPSTTSANESNPTCAPVRLAEAELIAQQQQKQILELKAQMEQQKEFIGAIKNKLKTIEQTKGTKRKLLRQRQTKRSKVVKKAIQHLTDQNSHVIYNAIVKLEPTVPPSKVPEAEKTDVDLDTSNIFGDWDGIPGQYVTANSGVDTSLDVLLSSPARSAPSATAHAAPEPEPRKEVPFVDVSHDRIRRSVRLRRKNEVDYKAQAQGPALPLMRRKARTGPPLVGELLDDKTNACFLCAQHTKFCTTHTTKWKYVRDTKGYRKGQKHYARNTLPSCCLLARTKLCPGPGSKGVFAKQTIPQWTVFGPYQGVNVHPKFHESHRRSYYVWTTSYKGKQIMIDGRSSKQSNWMRYVNHQGAPANNIHMLSRSGQIYYCAFSEIQPKEELLVDYGTEFEDQMIAEGKLKTLHMFDGQTYDGEL